MTLEVTERRALGVATFGSDRALFAMPQEFDMIRLAHVEAGGLYG
jgi:hypothetical protein